MIKGRRLRGQCNGALDFAESRGKSPNPAHIAGKAGDYGSVSVRPY
jgi:hypothetical protein